MDVKFLVHNVTQTVTNVPVDFDGETVMADVPCLRVELAAGDAQSGSLTLNFTGSDIATAITKFPVGQTITWTL